MNVFAKNLAKSNKEIKAQRAELISESAQAEQEDLVRNLKRKRRELKTELMGLEDLSPDNSFSNNAVRGDFDAKQWVETLQRTEVMLLNNEIELSVAEKTLKKWFTDAEE